MRVAVVGTGWGIQVQVPAYRYAGFAITALWARTEAKAQAVARDAGIPFGALLAAVGGAARPVLTAHRRSRCDLHDLTATSDFGALLARDDVDVVLITTPPPTHRELLQRAIAAGKHVVCEKPTALSEDEAWAMHAASEAYHAAPTAGPRLHLIDHELRFLPTVQRMRELLRAGYCGNLFYLRLNINSPRMLKDRVRAQAGDMLCEDSAALTLVRLLQVVSTPPLPQEFTWWSEREQGGGVLGAVGSHLIDLVAFVTGERAASISARLCTHLPTRNATVTTSTGETRQEPRTVTSDDMAHFKLENPSGLVSYVHISFVDPAPLVHKIEALGSRGRLTILGNTLRGAQLPSLDDEPLVTNEEVDHPNLKGPFQTGTVRLAEALYAALAYNDTRALWPAAYIADGLYVQAVMDAARRSNDKRAWEPVPARVLELVRERDRARFGSGPATAV